MLRAHSGLVALAACAMLAGPVVATTTGKSSDADAAVRAVWSAVDAAWNARDADRFSRLFSEDATFLIVGRDQPLEGRSRIQARYADQFSRQSPELRHVSEVRRVQHLERGLAAVDLDVRVLRETDGAAGASVLRAFAVFAVMSAGSDAWQIRGVRIYQLPNPADAG